MCAENLLHFQRRYVLAPAHDDVFLAIDDLNVIVGIDGGDIAGMKPAALHHRLGRLGLAPITLHDAIAPHYDFAHASAVLRHIVPLSVEHSQFYPGDGKSGHRLASKALFAFPQYSWFCW